MPPFEVKPLVGAADDYDALLLLIGDASIVLLGEASHGTHEFYRERARITRRLIEERGFTAVAVEADWPDAYRVNRYLQGASDDGDAEEALRENRRGRFGDTLVLDRVFETLAASGQPRVLVIDDVHELTSPRSLQALEHLLQNLPSNLALVLATRADPPVSLAQARSDMLAPDRARGLLTLCAAAIVVLLAAFGFHGTQRYVVMAGRREYAIRAAIGATPRALGRLVFECRRVPVDRPAFL